MDVNGLPMWQIAGAADFGFGGAGGGPEPENLDYRESSGHLRLARQQEGAGVQEDETFARGLASAPSPTADDLGGFAWWDFASNALQASGFADGSVELPLPTPGEPFADAPEDIALGTDQVVYVARGGAVIMRDLRERWEPAAARKPDFHAHLIAPLPGGGAWAFDKTRRRLARIAGYPLRFTGLRDPDPERFEPAEPNRNPPRLIVQRGQKLPAEFDAVSLAASEDGRLALLAWQAGKDSAIFTLEEEGFVLRLRTKGIRFPHSLAWIGEAEVAVLSTDGKALARQAFVYPLDLPPGERSLRPDGRVHPLLAAHPARFCNTLSPVPLYLVREEPGGPPVQVRPLRALSGGLFARTGSVVVGPIDSGTPGCVWHRLYAEASNPDGGAIDIEAFASERAASPAAGDKGWCRHRIAPVRDPDLPADIAHAAWSPEASEIAFAPSRLACPRRAGASGLFNLLLQAPGRRVRRLEGRYLWLRITLSGDRHGSPELAALRVYANRFSYRDRYLPAFYRETLGGIDGRAAGPATPPDFLDRMLGLFEGQLTELEGKVASSWLLTDPAAAPPEALPWIGRWIGVEADEEESPGRLRQTLLAAPHTAALNGTLGGLLAALELATGGIFVTGGRLDPGRRAPPPGTPAVARIGDSAVRALMLSMDPAGDCAMLAGGAVTRGDIVVVEGFRLRRTFATILGADLYDEQDPLTLGLAASGNSFVGDTLILGDEARAELMALYRPEVEESRRDAQAVQSFYARLAHRVLILVRGVSDPAEMRRLREVAEEAVPAHVEPQLHSARQPLIVGAASLVGIDTYLAQAVPFERVTLGRSILGTGDFVAGSGQLDPRADAPASRPPQAVARGPADVWAGSRFTLSAADSRAAEGRSIDRYIWTWD